MILLSYFILTIIILIVLTVVFLPRQLFLWLITYIKKQKYHSSFQGVNYLDLDNPQIILSTHINLFVTILINRVTLRKTTVFLSTKSKFSFIIRLLMKRCSIHRIDTTEEIESWDKKGTLVILNSQYKHAKNLGVSGITLEVCGCDHALYTKGKNVDQTLHLNFFKKISWDMSEKEKTDLFGLQSIYAWQHYIEHAHTIPELWMRQSYARKNKLVIADSLGTELTATKMLIGTIAMNLKLEPLLRSQKRVAICLPPSVGGSMAMLSVLMQGKTMVNLNYTASSKSLDLAINKSEVNVIITSGRFIEQLLKKGFDIEDVFSQCQLIFLEDIKAQLDKFTLLKTMLEVKFSSANRLVNKYITKSSMSDTATILFSSGSEGSPKGVELSHMNLVSNVKQSFRLLEAEGDSTISFLPTFHAFGLIATTLLPLTEGLFFVCHTDPTDAITVGKLVQKYKLTMLCGTSTFFRLYAKNRNIKKEMFSSIRVVISGAERLQPEVRVMFKEKFDKNIIEGYGATELSPVASSNQPDKDNVKRNFIGTVGKSVHGGKFMIIDPETKKELPVGEEGMITLGGVNVMKGYLEDPIKTNEVVFKRHRIRWYETGDKGKIDKNGYLIIVDRYSRFAKLGGEMVSLSMVETEVINKISSLYKQEEIELLAVVIPDSKKGEKVVMLYNFDFDAHDFKTLINQSDMNNLMKPSMYIKIDSIPKLGTGKTDFAASKKLVLSLINK